MEESLASDYYRMTDKELEYSMRRISSKAKTALEGKIATELLEFLDKPTGIDIGEANEYWDEKLQDSLINYLAAGEEAKESYRDVNRSYFDEMLTGVEGRTLRQISSLTFDVISLETIADPEKEIRQSF